MDYNQMDYNYLYNYYYMIYKIGDWAQSPIPNPHVLLLKKFLF